MSFTKADLKTGMVVTIRDGRKYLVLRDICSFPLGDIMVRVFEEGMGHLSVGEYNDDLTHVRPYLQGKFDIMVVQAPKCAWGILRYLGDRIAIQDHEFETVYRRIKPKEMTLKEIEDELGYPVVVREE